MAQQPEPDLGEDAPLHAEQATGQGRVTGRRVQRTVNFDQEVLDRARAAAAHLAAHAPEAGVRSLADIVNPAVAERVAELEERFNSGQPFDPVFRLPAGRPRDRADS
jgi:hypothetical protein